MTDYYTCSECWGNAMYCGCIERKRATVNQNSTVGQNAITDIVRERARQITGEGWTREHDDEHKSNELARAAACYAYGDLLHSSTGPIWPWHDYPLKPGRDRRHDLVRAAALIIAEIERLDRAALENSNG